VRVGVWMRRAALVVAAAGAGALAPGAGAGLGPRRAAAEEPWRAEFDAVCAKTQDAMALSTADLSSLVARCDALMPKLEALEEGRRKVFARRLQACRDLYQFVLDYRAKAGS
jgi:hypothetical protein